MSISEALLDDIRNRIGLADLIGRHVRLTRRGREHEGLCPFHMEKTPSFRVYDDHYHCFGCGAHGSLFDFVMQTERLTFPQAVERLADMAGVARPQVRDRGEEQHRRMLLDAIEAAVSFYEEKLHSAEGNAAREYLAGRGLGRAEIRRFRLGYAPSGRSALRTSLGNAGVTDAAMVEAGLVVLPDDRTATVPYDRFRNRIVFPIADRRGRFVGFGGRLLGPGEPKYLNTAETPLFHKGRLLYGMPAAAEAARRTGRLIVVEGYMDAIGLALAGYEETVAPLGTAVTEEQLQEFWRMAPSPILCFDPDVAGRRAAARVCDRALPLLRPGLGLRFAFLATETGDDPDGVARRYPAQFLARTFAEAVPMSAMLVWLETGGRAPATPEERAAVIGRLQQRAESVTDRTMRAQFLAGLRDAVPRARSGRSETGPRRGGASGRKGSGQAPVVRGPAAAGPADGRAFGAKDVEVTLLAILCRHPSFFHEVEEEIGAVIFVDGERDRLRQGLIGVLSGGDDVTIPQVRAALPDEAVRAMMDAVLNDPIVPILRRHPFIAAEASIEHIRATWRASINRLRRLTDASEPPSANRSPSDLTDETLARRLARKRALLDEQEREEPPDTG